MKPAIHKSQFPQSSTYATVVNPVDQTLTSSTAGQPIKLSVPASNSAGNTDTFRGLAQLQVCRRAVRRAFYILQRSYQRAAAAICVFLPIFGVVSSYAAGQVDEMLVVTGAVRHYQVERSGRTNLVMFREFEAAGSSNMWSIRSWIAAGQPQSPHYAIESDTVSSDGFDVFHKIETNPAKYEANGAPKFAKAPKQEAPPKSVTKSIVAYSGPVPFMDSAYSAAIWLPYFGANTRWWSTNQTVKNLFAMDERAYRQITLSALAAPLSADHDTVGILRLSNNGTLFVRERDGVFSERKRKPPYTNGFVETEYKAFEGERISVGWFPRRSVVQYFRSKPGAASNKDTELYAFVEVIAGSITTTNGALPIPSRSLSGDMTFVIDKRGTQPKNKPTSYVTTNKIYSTNSIEIKNIKSKQDLREGATKWFGAKFSKRMIVLFAFVGVTSLCGFGVWRIKR